jgi:uncharacterized protein YprB with RNaseH-like and TPR domain
MESGPAYSGISRAWRSRIAESHDYTIIGHDAVFKTSFHDSWVYQSYHSRARDQLSCLLAAYEGMNLDEAFRGREQETYEGVCYCIQSREPLGLSDADRQQIHERLLSDLSLVHGVGKKMEQRLKERGFLTIRDLTSHRRFGKAASEALKVLLSNRPGDIAELVTRWHSSSHILAFLTSGLYPSRDLLFIDLETLGFFSRPIILFGLAEVKGQELVISQYLIRGIDEELPSLSAVHEQLHDDRVIVSYNGKAFDIPYLVERSAFYSRPVVFRNPHYDLLHNARKKWRQDFVDCRLGTLERQLFGTERHDDIPSAMVPEFYESYLTTGNCGPLVPIVSHNRQDLISLARLFCLLREVP